MSSWINIKTQNSPVTLELIQRGREDVLETRRQLTSTFGYRTSVSSTLFVQQFLFNYSFLCRRDRCCDGFCFPVNMCPLNPHPTSAGGRGSVGRACLCGRAWLCGEGVSLWGRGSVGRAWLCGEPGLLLPPNQVPAEVLLYYLLSWRGTSTEVL